VILTDRGVGGCIVDMDMDSPAAAVRASTAGFQAFERQNIELEVGKDERIDAQLTPGQITQTITVSETIPLLDSTSATITGTIPGRTNVIEASSDFIAWQPIGTNIAASTAMSYTDGRGTNFNQTFYRVRLVP